MRPRPGAPTEGLLSLSGIVFRCALGRSGISSRKREGDGATPLGRFRLLSGYFRRGRMVARSALPLRAITPDLGWCDAASDRNYNRPVKLPYPTSHERMLRADHLYDACLVMDWNIRPRRRGAGSAIFLHIARPGYRPTEGCIAVSPLTMARLLPLLSTRTVVRVIQ